MTRKQPTIFISIGRPQCDAQREFKLSLISAVRARGFEARTVGSGVEDTDVPHTQPIQQIRSVIRKCDGAVVVAYERHMAPKLLRDSLTQHPAEIQDARFSTSWNHAEAAMAYLAGVPILLVCEEGLWRECVFEEGTIGQVAHLHITKNAPFEEVFQKQMTSWADDVNEGILLRTRNRFLDMDADALRMKELVQILGNLTWKSGLTLAGGLLTACYVLLNVGAHFPGLRWPL